MNVERLVTMANDIAAFFASEADKQAAAEQVAAHLRRFWEPRMRATIRQHLSAGGAGLNELARRGVELLQ
jgi:formate dehydrogenase subunit delta